MTPHKEITSGLQFPEGPIAMPDGSVILVEIARETLTRVMPDGKQHIVAKLGGGPNGAAMVIYLNNYFVTICDVSVTMFRLTWYQFTAVFPAAFFLAL